MNIMKAESPVPSVSRLVPKVRSTAKILYGIYIGMTILEIVLLLIGKMPLFDALTLSFGTAGTRKDLASATTALPVTQYTIRS